MPLAAACWETGWRDSTGDLQFYTGTLEHRTKSQPHVFGRKSSPKGLPYSPYSPSPALVGDDQGPMLLPWLFTPAHSADPTAPLHLYGTLLNKMEEELVRPEIAMG